MTDAQEAAFRLACAFSEAGRVRTHHQPVTERKPYAAKPKIGKNPKVVTGKGRGSGQGHPLVIDGKQYATCKEARKRLHVGNCTIRAWLASGRAVKANKI